MKESKIKTFRMCVCPICKKCEDNFDNHWKCRSDNDDIFECYMNDVNHIYSIYFIDHI